MNWLRIFCAFGIHNWGDWTMTRSAFKMEWATAVRKCKLCGSTELIVVDIIEWYEMYGEGPYRHWEGQR